MQSFPIEPSSNILADVFCIRQQLLKDSKVRLVFKSSEYAWANEIKSRIGLSFSEFTAIFPSGVNIDLALLTLSADKLASEEILDAPVYEGKT
jgi:hypothetical protein